MTGEARIARCALIWSASAAIPAAVVAYPIAGAQVSISILLGAGIILFNLGLTTVFAIAAEHIGGRAPMMLSLPSFGIRMLGSFLMLQLFKGRDFIDETAFVSAFCGALAAVVILQARAWKRTPWLVQAFDSKKEIA